MTLIIKTINDDKLDEECERLTEEEKEVWKRLKQGIQKERMRIDSNGNVGISTNAPQHKLYIK